MKKTLLFILILLGAVLLHAQSHQHHKITIDIEMESAPCILEVDPPNLYFLPNSFSSGTDNSKNVTVTTSIPAGWIISGTIPAWLDIMHTSGTDGQTFTVSTKSNNPSTTAMRTATITVKAGELSKTVIVVQGCDGSGTVVKAEQSYVGAFWKQDQTGERVIKMTHTGNWTALVAWYDALWGASDGIVLSTAPSVDNDMYSESTADMNNPANDATYTVSGTTTMVSGNGDIFFRIGLRQPFAATTANPARYALVIIIHSSGAQKLFIRQGESPDYLPRDNQHNRARWSPYNLGKATDRTLYDKVEYGLVTTGFVAYPTQAGYFYQWANSANPYHPTTPKGSVSGWPTGNTGSFILTGVCPTGYIMPTGSNVTTEATDLDYCSILAETIFGYYADGFFDRRQIVNAAANSNSGTFCAVSSEETIAYRGTLFFNPNTNASLFFPASGRRAYTNGALESSGNIGDFWTRPTSSQVVYRMGLSSGTILPSISLYRQYGLSVRCVKQ